MAIESRSGFRTDIAEAKIALDCLRAAFFGIAIAAAWRLKTQLLAFFNSTPLILETIGGSHEPSLRS